MTEEQRLIIALILRSHRSWQRHELETLMRYIGARPTIAQELTPEEVIQDGPAFCIGCGEELIWQQMALPTFLYWCSNCEMDKPLKVRAEWLRAGEAKLEYIQDIFFWPNHLTLLSYINEVLKWMHKR